MDGFKVCVLLLGVYSLIFLRIACLRVLSVGGGEGKGDWQDQVGHRRLHLYLMECINY